MAFTKNNVIIDHDLKRLGGTDLYNYVAHVLRLKGSFSFGYNVNHFTLHGGEAMIIGTQRLFEGGDASADLEAVCIYVSPEFLRTCTPKNNYDITGILSLFNNPIFELNEQQQKRLKRDYDAIEERLNDDSHHFQEDIMECCTQILFLDFYEFHAHNNEGIVNISLQTKTVMSGFLAMLDRGEYVRHRGIGYYADKLCVTAKYLSEVCKQVSGMGANYWINRFAALHIRQLLLEKELSFTEISDKFDFSSPAYFTRFVQKNLGAPPSAFRE